MQDQAVQRLKRGDVVDIMIKSIVPYGAFGNIVDPQTKQVTGGSVSPRPDSHSSACASCKPRA